MAERVIRLSDGTPMNVDTVDYLLSECCRFGEVRLSQMDDKEWHASVKLQTPSEFMTSDVKSRFDHKTPVDALRHLLNTLLELKRKQDAR